jgi:hypothetical protein
MGVPAEWCMRARWTAAISGCMGTRPV